MHTPGPWQFIENTVQPTSRTRFEGCNICRVTMPHDGLAAEAMANTRLIAAAPDLLAALEAWQELRDSDGADGRDAVEWIERVERQMRDAIVKAKGGA